MKKKLERKIKNEKRKGRGEQMEERRKKIQVLRLCHFPSSINNSVYIDLPHEVLPVCVCVSE